MFPRGSLGDYATHCGSSIILQKSLGCFVNLHSLVRRIRMLLFYVNSILKSWRRGAIVGVHHLQLCLLGMKK